VSTILVIPRTSLEYLPIVVRRAGTPVTTGVKTQVTDDPTQTPSGAWINAVAVDGGIAHLLQPSANRGYQHLWVQVTDGAEVAVEALGRIYRS